MIFLGQAANYRFGQIWGHLFAHGSAKHSLALRRALAEKYQTTPKTEERVALYHTGRSALCAAVEATVPKGSAVVITGLTCIAVVRAVRAAGCVPIFADINRETLQFDAASLQKAIDKSKHMRYNVRAIVVQNTLGRPLEMGQIEQLAARQHLVIIEDLAHCAGRFYPDGREVGTVGAAVALSFGKGKAIDTIEGGALILRALDLRMPNQPLRKPRRGDRWRDRWYPVLGWLIRGGYHIGLGKALTAIFLKLHWIMKSADAELNLDTRLTDWQAKLALKQLSRLPRGVLREGILVRDRAKLLQELREKGYLLDEIWYDVPVSPLRYAKEVDFPTEACPETVRVAEQIINLPTYYDAERLRPVRELIESYRLAEESE